MIALRTELELGRDDKEQLKADLHAAKVCCLGGKDVNGRGIIWIRLRYHDPKVSKPQDLWRLVATVMLEVLKDVDVQRKGLIVINDMTGLKLKNLDPPAAKGMFGHVFPRLPIRVGRICIFNPPWVVGHVILPIAKTFMSKKLRERIVIINGFKPAELLSYAAPSSLPAELEGTLAFDEKAWAEGIIAQL
jgi:hypothetical protein